jgi:multidrug efflux system outer membrane protein
MMRGTGSGIDSASRAGAALTHVRVGMRAVHAGPARAYAGARSTLTLSALAFALAGCAMAPHAPPAATLTMPTAWRTPAPAAAVDPHWWSSFGDAALDALVQQALANNTDLHGARLRLDEYRARVRVADSSAQPALTASVTPARVRQLNAFVQPVDVTSYAGSFQASYEIDVWGKLANATLAARADLQSQQAAADAAALSVAAQAASGYLNLRGLDAQLALAQATLVSRKSSLDLATRQFEVGYSSRLDLNQAEAEYRATAGAVPQLQRAIAQQENALSQMVGANPGPVARGVELGKLTAPAVSAGVPSELLRRRPDIAQAERAVVASDASLAVARDQLLPSVRLSATAGFQAFSSTQLVNHPFELWSIGGSVLAPIFDGGRLRAQADIAASQRDRALVAYEGVVRNAFVETDNALVSVQRLREQLEQAQERLRAATEVLRIAHNRYANGYASYLEELDAQRTHYSVEVNVLQLEASLLAAHVDLYRALGGGWTAPDAVSRTL